MDSLPGIRVLFVDDDEDYRILFREVLREVMGASVSTLDNASSVPEALSLVGKSSYDVLLFDYNLGAGTGIDLLKAVRQTGIETPVIFLTGAGDEEIAAAAMKAGAGDYLVKNRITPQLLSNSIRYVINLHEKEFLRRRAEEELRSERDFTKGLVDTAQAVILVLDLDGKITYVNSYMEELSGYRIGELHGKDWFETFPPRRCRNRIRELFRETPARIRTGGNNYPIVTWDGREVEIEWYDKALRDRNGSISGILCVGHDITERRRYEEALERARSGLEIQVGERAAELIRANEELLSYQEKLRNLNAHLQHLREEERTRIAREIHDELGQTLMALKMDAYWISGKSGDHKQISEKGRSMVETIDETIRTVKRICTELRPAILDHFDLGAALEWQAKEFEEKTGIICEVIPGPGNTVLDRDRTTALFRVFQEALTNVMKHAKANKVVVSLQREDGMMVLRIVDNGLGVTGEEMSKPDSFGLLGMRERMRPFGGTISISGAKDKGTTITVCVPVPVGKDKA